MNEPYLTLEQQAEQFADSKDRRLTSYWAGLKEGYIAAGDRLKELEAGNQMLEEIVKGRAEIIEKLHFDFNSQLYELKKENEELKQRIPNTPVTKSLPMKQKTSIQQLIDFIEYHKFSSAIRLSLEDIVKEAERLKDLHRKEIEDATRDPLTGTPRIDYYNETFEQ